MIFPHLLGNEKLKKRLESDITRGTLTHAYIIEAPYGSGKHTLAREIAASFSCTGRERGEQNMPCGVCPSCRKIFSGVSPDVITIGREDGKAQLGVDVIRRLREDVFFAPNDLDVKTYIIEDAHTMNVQAQNAFLLTLEEPPEYVVFLLLCEDAGALLETVRSRAPVIRLSALPDTDVKNALAKNADGAKLLRESEAEFDETVKLACGSIGRALDLLDKGKREPLLKSRRDAAEVLRLAAGKRKGREAIFLIGSFPQKRDELSDRFDDIELAARDLLALKKADAAPLCFFTPSEAHEATELAFGYKSETLFGIVEAAERAKSRLLYNANVRLTVCAFAAECGLI